ncbi:MAG: pilin [Candidatus Omnitrophica bacterium]|nr:pilin [Candidatus Omnitrophota bacterium]
MGLKITPAVQAQGEWNNLLEGDVPTIKSLESVFGNILNVASAVAGIALFIVLIVGGFNYLTSGGDPEKLKKAGQTITSGLTGLFLLILVWFIFLLIEQFTGVNITSFEIPGPEI